MKSRQILLCTVGTSLFSPNLQGLARDLAVGTTPQSLRPLAEAHHREDWPAVALLLTTMDSHERICGAEINSVASLLDRGHVAPTCGMFFFHSDTEDGRRIGNILSDVYWLHGHAPVETVLVPDLQDADPRRFRTSGLRNLARCLCKVIRDYGAPACAINATGGYKAQIAIAVLIGQALGVPVYYKHERFDEVIAFPPMPVALDFEVWMRASGMLFELERSPDPAPIANFEGEWDERYESLVERVEIDGSQYIELSPTGQIFHDTFKDRFRREQDRVLPPAVEPANKKKPRLEAAGWPGAHPEVERYMQALTDDVPQVTHCATFYFNPDRPERTRFRMGSSGIEGILSDGTYCVKFRVETSATTSGHLAAVVAGLNQWLVDRGADVDRRI